MALDHAAVAAPEAASETVRIPPLIKRNTLLLALSQAFAGSGHQMVYALGPLMVVQLLHSATLSGVGIALVGGTRLLISYPFGKFTDTYGRKPGMTLGIVVGIIGSFLMMGSMALTSFPIYVAGMLCMGVATSAAHQLRVAAADMYPPSRRAEGVGYVLTGSMIGVFVGPAFVALAQALSPSVGIHPLGLSWLFAPMMAVPALIMVFMVHPDPRQIAANLAQYYPGLHVAGPTEAPVATLTHTSPWTILRHPTRLAAIVANFAAQGNMGIVMVTTSIALSHHGHDITAISASLALHSIGMFGFSLPIGRVTDDYGRRVVLLTGIIVEAVGGFLVGAVGDYVIVSLGAFLVGLGWSCINVASTAVIADTTLPTERGRAIGTNDAIGGSAAILLPLVAGQMSEWINLWSTGVLAVALMIPALFLVVRIHEPQPGIYQSGQHAEPHA